MFQAESKAQSTTGRVPKELRPHNPYRGSYLSPSGSPMHLDLYRSGLNDSHIAALEKLQILTQSIEFYQITYPKYGGGASVQFVKRWFNPTDPDKRYTSRPKTKTGTTPQYPLILDLWIAPKPLQQYEVCEGAKKLMAALLMGLQGCGINGAQMGVVDTSKAVVTSDDDDGDEGTAEDSSPPKWRLVEDFKLHILAAMEDRPYKDKPLEVVLGPDGDASTNKGVNRGYARIALALEMTFGDKVVVMVRKYKDPKMKLDDLYAAGLKLDEHTEVVPWQELLQNFPPMDACEAYGLNFVEVKPKKGATYVYIPCTNYNVIKMIERHPALHSLSLNIDTGLLMLNGNTMSNEQAAATGIAQQFAEVSGWKPHNGDFSIPKAKEVIAFTGCQPWFRTKSPKRDALLQFRHEWDGINRLDTFASDYLYLPDINPRTRQGQLNRMWARALLTGACARVIEPGSVFRFFHIMISRVQGPGKSGIPAALTYGLDERLKTTNAMSTLWKMDIKDGALTEQALRSLYMIKGIANIDDMEKWHHGKLAAIKSVVSGGSFITGSEMVKFLYKNEIPMYRPNVPYGSSNADKILIPDPSGQTRNAVIRPGFYGRANQPGGVDFPRLKAASGQLLAECVHWICKGRFSEEFTWEEFEPIYLEACNDTAADSVDRPLSMDYMIEALRSLDRYHKPDKKEDLAAGMPQGGLAVGTYTGKSSTIPKGHVVAVKLIDADKAYRKQCGPGKWDGQTQDLLHQLGFVASDQLEVVGRKCVWVLGLAKFMEIMGGEHEWITENGD